MASYNSDRAQGVRMEGLRRNTSRRIRSLKSEIGASLVEYAILIALIASVAIGAVTLVGRDVKGEFDCVALEFDNARTRALIDEKAHNDHWHALSPGEEAYARACLDGVVFKPNPQKS